MKLLLFGDNHGDQRSLEQVKQKAPQADLLICIGDITVFEKDIKPILDQLNQLNKKVLLVHGNHEDDSTLKTLCEPRDNLFFIHDGIYQTDNYAFVGYGGGGFAQNDPHFDKRSKLYRLAIKNKKHILVLHQPPYGYVDVVNGRHTGNKSFTHYIQDTHPVLVCCGHIHDCSGKTATAGKTTIINVKPEGVFFEI